MQGFGESSVYPAYYLVVGIKVPLLRLVIAAINSEKAFV
jgi:hypothetical protein